MVLRDRIALLQLHGQLAIPSVPYARREALVVGFTPGAAPTGRLCPKPSAAGRGRRCPGRVPAVSPRPCWSGWERGAPSELGEREKHGIYPQQQQEMHGTRYG